MARRRVKVELTLFPFLSVLAGLIAVLMLFMIVTVSTRVIAAEEKAAKSSSRKTEINKTGAEDGIDLENYELFRQEVDRLAGLLAERQREHEALRVNVEQLEDLIESKKDEFIRPARGARRVGVKLGEPTPVSVVPARGHAGTKKPIFVEVSATGYVVYPDKTAYRTVEKKRVQGKERLVADPDPQLAKFLAGVGKQSKSTYLVFLIHPNGAAAWRNLMEFLFEHHPQVDTGWEPFSPDWLLIAK